MNILISRMPSAETTETFFTPRVMDALRPLGELREGVFSRDELREALSGVDVLFCGWGVPKMDDDLLAKADRLKLVCYTGGSVADFMTEDVVKRGITVCSGNRLYANSVAEGTIGYILLAQRRLPAIINRTASEGWCPQCRTDGIRFKTIGLIGFGMIVKYLAKMLQAFDCKVKICSDYFKEEDEAEYRAEKCGMDEIFSTCDIVSVHESLREDTWHLTGRRYFDMMKPDALFLNTARGPIIVEEDLAAVCREGKIRAVLDVYEHEPLPMDSCLRGIDSIILIPHRGGPTWDIREYVTLALIDDLKRFTSGQPLEHEIPWEYAKHMTQAPHLLRKKMEGKA